MQNVNWERVAPLTLLFAVLGIGLGLVLGSFGRRFDSLEVGLLVQFALALVLSPLLYLIVLSILLRFGVPLGFEPQKQNQRGVHALLYGVIVVATVLASTLSL